MDASTYPILGKISLAGDLGSGKSTVSKILIERLGAKYHSTGAICRAIAKEHGLDVVQINVYIWKRTPSLIS